MSETTNGAEPPDYGFIALQWWRTLTGHHPNKKETGGDRAARASLRRASPADAMCEDATLRLFRALGLSQGKLARVATLAGILATIREDERQPFGRRIGREKIDDEQSAPLSLLRFKRLLDAETEDEIAIAFRRAIAIAGGTVNVRDAAKILLDFDNETTRRRLVLDYYGAGERDSDSQTQPAAS